MESLNGIFKISRDFLNDLEEIGTLLFQEFPSTSVYQNQKNEIFIREWVDCSNDGLVDRYFLFKTNKKYLAQFIKSEISHLEFIYNSIDKITYFFDKNAEVYSDIEIVSLENLPIDYLPEDNYIISQYNIVDYRRIIDILELENYNTKSDLEETVKKISQSKKTDIYNLHLIKGKGISHGRIKTNTLSKALKEFDSLYKNVALDIHLGKTRGNVNKNKDDDSVDKYVNTEVVDTLAASFSILIKPFYNEYLLFENKTSSEIIADSIFDLFHKSMDSEKFVNVYQNYSEFTISSYKDFLTEIYTDNLNVQVSYFSNENQIRLSQDYDLISADKILNYINNFTFSETENFQKIGKFRAINCNTGSFTFESIENETYKGFFDELIKKGSETISFTKIYRISLNRKITKEASKERPKFEDIIVAFYEHQ